MSRVVAVCGKGGVGKTTVAAVLAAELQRRGGRRALIVDADHAGGLTMALGIPVKRSLNQVRLETIAEIKKAESSRRDLALSIDYLLMEAVTERGPLAFLSLGRPEEAGCYCSVNTLLRNAIELLARDFDLTLIDAEAGVEQVSRQVMSAVDQLILVSDPSAKGLKVAAEILVAAQRLGQNPGAALLINRVRSPEDFAALALPPALRSAAAVPEDDAIRRFDLQALSFFDLPENPASQAVIAFAETIGVL